MKQQNAKWMLLAPAMAAIVMFLGQPLRAEVLETTKNVGGTTVHYKTVLPNGYDPAKAYPAILALGGGPQTMNTVDNILNRNFRAEAEKRGYIVVAPAAPDNQLFFQEGDRIFPEFLKMIQADYKIRDNKFHIAGVSNGGIAALHVAAANPQYFLSVTAFPGYMWEPSAAKLQAISKMCVFMYVGEFDPYMWHGEMKKEAEFLHAIASRKTSHTGWRPSRAPTPGACSMGLKRPRRAAASKGGSPPLHFSGTMAVTSTSTIMPGHASWVMLSSVWAGGGFTPNASERHLP
jgi:poly(3-hydroxybutyrate) depolymerase